MKCENLKQEHEKAIVSASSELAQLQKQHEKKIDKSKQKEEWYIVEKEISREELAELGQILMAISNIAVRCQRKKKVSSDEKAVHEMNLDEKLESIKEFVKDLNDVFRMAQDLRGSARSGPGSGPRRGRVHFIE